MLSPDKDPLGKAIADHFDGKSGVEVQVLSNVAEGASLSGTHLFRRLFQLPELERMAIDLCKGRVLDIGAGAGAHSLILQERNMAVTAIDISPLAVSTMQKRGIADARCIDVFELRGEKWDTLLLLMNGIGLCGTIEGLQRFLEYAKTLLNENGQILLDSSDLTYLFMDEEGGMLINLAGAYYGEISYEMEYDGMKGEPFRWLYVDFDTLAYYAEAAGYHCELMHTGQSWDYMARLRL